MPSRARAVVLLLVLPFLAACQNQAAPAPSGGAPTGAAATGKQLFVSKGCIACHRAPGVPEAQGTIGPNLRGEGDPTGHPQIAGAIPNTPENMVRWLLNPPAVKPGTAMPNLGLTQDEAQSLAAFVETLK